MGQTLAFLLWGPHVRFRRVQTLVREGGPVVGALKLLPILLSPVVILRRGFPTDVFLAAPPQLRQASETMGPNESSLSLRVSLRIEFF